MESDSAAPEAAEKQHAVGSGRQARLLSRLMAKARERKAARVHVEVEEESDSDGEMDVVIPSRDEAREAVKEPQKKKQKKRKRVEAVLKATPRLEGIKALLAATVQKKRRVLTPVSTASELERHARVAGASLEVKTAAAAWKLHPALLQALVEDGITDFFPIQATAIPAILKASRRRVMGVPPPDICLSAPTGSGKTLVFVLCMLDILSSRVLPALRALVLLPTRDLALQVAAVAERYAQPLGLRVVAAVGDSAVRAEGRRIMGDDTLPMADVLVATPGRLVDHLKMTAGFTLSQLRLLVIDEADRLMNGSYNDWILRVTQAAAQPPPAHHDGDGGEEAEEAEEEKQSDEEEAGGKGEEVAVARYRPQVWRHEEDDGGEWRYPLQKILCSATLTDDPEQMAKLALHTPLYFTATGGGSITGPVLPAKLTQFSTKVPAPLKPLALLQLLVELREARSLLVFCNSLETTHWVTRLLQLYGGFSVAEFSSALPQRQRTRTLAAFREQKLRMLVCSDTLSRGVDVPAVDVVINYDAPFHSKAYVHRVGRTARAGRSGRAFTLLERKRAYNFFGMARSEKLGDIQRKPTDRHKMTELRPRYRACLDELQHILDREERRLLAPHAPLPRWLVQPTKLPHALAELDADVLSSMRAAMLTNVWGTDSRV